MIDIRRRWTTLQTHVARIKYRSRSDQFRIYTIGDIHAGIKHCAEDEIKKLVAKIEKDDFARWVGMGDYADCITPHDKRWDWGVIAPWVEPDNVVRDQEEWLVRLFEPIKDKCLGLLRGNHEESVRLYNSENLQANLCNRLGVTNLGYSCFLRLIFQRTSTSDHQQFECHFEHGSGCARTDGARAIRLARAMLAFDSEIVAMGHLHDIKINNQAPLHMDKAGHIKHRPRGGAITGGWLKGYLEGVDASYIEKDGAAATIIGCPWFTIIPKEYDVSVTSSWKVTAHD